MFPNPFRKLKELWSGTGAQAIPTANDGARAQEAPTANYEPRAQTQDSSAATHQAYRDAHNLPILHTRYARPAPADSTATANLFGNGRPSTTFPSKHSFFTAPPVRPALNNTGAPPCRINNISPPQASLFGAAFAAPYVSNSETPNSNATPRFPPTPPSTPPEEQDIPRPSTETPKNTTQSATVGNDHTEGGRSQTTPLPDEPTNRPQLQPKRQQDRHHKSATPKCKEDWVSQIVYEKDTPENYLPAGYTGTFRGQQYYDPNYSDMLECGYNNLHRLICGHYIESTEPCGSNCKTEQLEEKAFDCPTCRDIVHDVIYNKLTPAEATKVARLKEKGDGEALIGCYIEYVTRHAPQLTVGVMEAVLVIARKDYGRACKHSEAPPPIEVQPLEDTVRNLQQRHERRHRDKNAGEHPLTDPVKRKAFEEAMNLPTILRRFGSPVEDGGGEKLNREHKNKKQKTKLESHQKTITENTRGTKRPSSHNDDTKMTDAANKKQKTKRTPLGPSPFASVLGAKRKVSPTAEEVFNPAIMKKACILQPSKFGVSNFLAPPAHIVGPIIRKRACSEEGGEVEVEVEIESAIDGEEKRRGKRACWQKDGEEEERGSAFKMRVGEFAALERASREWDGEEEL